MLLSNNSLILHLCFVTFLLNEIMCESFYSCTKQKSKKYSYNFPEDSGKPSYYDRYTPISLETARTKPTKVPEMKIVFSNDAQLITNNTGDRVESVLTRGNITLTGGCLLNKVYNFSQSMYSIDAVPLFTRSSTLIDGIGFPITHIITWILLGLTEDEAFTKPDGFLQMSISVKPEGNIDNKKFEPYAYILEKVRQFNTTTNSSAYDVLGFLFDSLPNNCYYCFPGSRNAPVTDEELPVAIHMIMSTKIIPTISYRQYREDYLKVLNPVNQTFVKVGACYEQGNRPVLDICDPIRVNYGGCH